MAKARFIVYIVFWGIIVFAGIFQQWRGIDDPYGLAVATLVGLLVTAAILLLEGDLVHLLEDRNFWLIVGFFSFLGVVSALGAYAKFHDFLTSVIWGEIVTGVVMWLVDDASRHPHSRMPSE